MRLQKEDMLPLSPPYQSVLRVCDMLHDFFAHYPLYIAPAAAPKRSEARITTSLGDSRKLF